MIATRSRSLSLAIAALTAYLCGPAAACPGGNAGRNVVFSSLLIQDGALPYLPMNLTTEAKQELFAKHSLTKSATDTGSAESQIALFTTRITHLTTHLKEHKKDHSTRLGLLKLVGKRRRLLNHLMTTEINRYRAIIAELGIRK